MYLATSEADARNRNDASSPRKQVIGNPKVYGAPVFTILDREMYDIAPANSAVLTFRNVHNWMAAGFASEAFRAMYRALKPGGVLGIEEHANPKDSKDYPRGVWALPPSCALGAAERPRYAAIGESDRMTLKFVKPAGRTPAAGE